MRHLNIEFSSLNSDSYKLLNVLQKLNELDLDIFILNHLSKQVFDELINYLQFAFK